jgi:iron complex outermembrane receptor protein
VAQADAPTPPAGERRSQRASDKVEEITVTARKMEEGLQETPVAVSAFRSEELAEQGVRNLQDISALVPNLTLKEGTYKGSNITIRGVGQRDIASFLDPGVGVYVDGVYMARGHGTLVSTLDVERIEVLRGPQGTLYGKNSVGGAVNFVTKKPGPDFEASGDIRWGNYDTLDGRVIVNVPLVEERIYSRWAFTSEHSDGWARNVVTGGEMSDRSRLAAAAQIRTLVTDSFTWDLQGSWSKRHEKARAIECIISDPTKSVIGFLPLDFATSVGIVAMFAGDPTLANMPAECNETRADGPKRVHTELPSQYDLDTSGVTNVFTWDVNEDWTVKHLSSWQRQEVRFVQEFDATSTRFASGTYLDPALKQKQVTQELQLSGRFLDGRASLTTGLFAFWEGTRGGDVNRFFLGGLSHKRGRDENDVHSRAAYGQLTYDVSDWIQVTGGLRYSWERKEVAVREFILTGGVPSSVRYEEWSLNWGKWTPLANVKLTAPDEWADRLGLDSAMVYATYAQGFKSGGVNGRGFDGPFDQENLDSYEIGFKTSAFENRITLNAALFWNSYEDIQLTTTAPDDMGQPNGVIRNAGEATLRGAEVELLAMPTAGLVLRASLGLTDAEYDKFVDQRVVGYSGMTAVFGPVDRSNEPFLDTPEFQVKASAQYTFGLDRLGLADAGSITPFVGVEIIDDAYHHLAPGGYYAVGEPYKQSRYALWNARLTWTSGDERLHVAAYAVNWSDREYIIGGTDFTDLLGMGTRVYGDPRRYGIEIGYRFE